MKRPDAGSRKVERRGGDRAKVRKVGRIMFDDPAKVVSCILMDLSDTGALLLVHDKVPDAFDLFYSAQRKLWRAVVVRRLQDTLGVRFEGEAEVLKSDDKRLRRLRGS